MALVTKLAEWLKELDRNLWPAHRVALEPALAASLRQRNLVVADVGSAEGSEERWLGIKHIVRFVNFEPNPRPSLTADNRTITLPVGLWSTKGRRTLHITEHPDSSSLYPANQKIFRDFLVKEGVREASTTEIDLDSLDNAIAARPDASPDFLKIDVEGADLEVLRGGQQVLAETVLGLRVETAWLELRSGGPRIAEIDAFLRDRGYALFHLSRVHWIRNNALHGFTSQPQLIWGDAVYFLTRDNFLARLAKASIAERESLLARYLVVLACHGVHDYSIELIDAALAAGLVSESFAQAARISVVNSVDSSIWYFVWSAVGLGFSILVFLACWLVPAARTRARYYLKQRAGKLFYELWRWAARAGRPANACIEDPFV